MKRNKNGHKEQGMEENGSISKEIKIEDKINLKISEIVNNGTVKQNETVHKERGTEHRNITTWNKDRYTNKRMNKTKHIQWNKQVN